MASRSATLFLFLSCLLMITTFASVSNEYSLEAGYSYGYLPKTSIPKKVILNVIDSCWRSKSNWATNRQALADCAVGFGKGAIGGKYGAIYVVTSPADDPDMVIRLKNELIMTSYKTIDGRGAKVEIGKAGLVRSSTTHVGRRGGSDGDAIDIFASSNIWIDHCFLARSADGLIDVIHASTAVTISNNYFSQHDKVMLLGHNDKFTADKVMKVTIVFNRFGEGLIERMPRVRIGYAHVANNRYDEWKMYAIGGSANPTILSEGNYFAAPNDSNSKQVTKREAKNGWKNWKWRTSKDVFINGAYFVPSGYGSCAPNYSKAQSFIVAPGAMVPALTASAGPLRCVVGKAC
ncbi:hypothetical protein Patl1_09966 [Pistacia atlantica]|uniref:Uncharacterized protein n=1 Tax=Pistacia atlantica TaxID=434234 RepID=A0ACC1A6E3_9ROSI|nr:hypothetical protein Patl1_09966 [Pistacia atlantica]